MSENNSDIIPNPMHNVGAEMTQGPSDFQAALEALSKVEESEQASDKQVKKFVGDLLKLISGHTHFAGHVDDSGKPVLTGVYSTPDKGWFVRRDDERTPDGEIRGPISDEEVVAWVKENAPEVAEDSFRPEWIEARTLKASMGEQDLMSDPVYAKAAGSQVEESAVNENVLEIYIAKLVADPKFQELVKASDEAAGDEVADEALVAYVDDMYHEQLPRPEDRKRVANAAADQLAG